jgi:hypothetical protein
MTATIHHHELFDWQKRQRAGEIYITGMEVTTKGYRLTYTETKGMPPLKEFNDLRGGALVSLTDGSQPSRELGQRAVEADDQITPAGSSPATPTIQPPVMVTCPNCTGLYAKGSVCQICERFARIGQKAKANK